MEYINKVHHETVCHRAAVTSDSDHPESAFLGLGVAVRILIRGHLE